MKRFRIDFSIRETDVPPEDAQGIRFGDEVDVNGIFDFFNKCRDAAMTLFNSVRPKNDPEIDKLKAALVQKDMLLMQLQKELERIKQAQHPHDQGPWEYRRDRKYWLQDQAADRGIPDDGSRGGDGPPTNVLEKALRDAKARRGL